MMKSREEVADYLDRYSRVTPRNLREMAIYEPITMRILKEQWIAPFTNTKTIIEKEF